MTALRELTWERRKTVDDALAGTEEEAVTLKRELTALDITVLGIGVIIGAGIFALTGNAAATEAGPGIMLSFVLAGVICTLAALCYAELAAMVPAPVAPSSVRPRAPDSMPSTSPSMACGWSAVGE